MAVTPSKKASTDSNGVLSEAIVQPASNSPQYTTDSSTCEIKLKGPYDSLKNANNLTMCDLHTAITRMPVTVSKNFDYPAPPAGNKWWVKGTSLEQLEAGDHGILTLTCDAVLTSYSPSGSSGSFDPYQDTWNLRWESYTVKPTAFCANDGHEATELTAATSGPDTNGLADRQHIHYFMEAGKDNSGYSDKVSKYWYRTQDGDFVLNRAEELVMKKIMQDRQALWHYPVLTHITTKYFSTTSANISSRLEYGESLGEDIDHIVDLPEECPYEFPTDADQNWEWVKTGDDMQHIKTKERISFQRTETYMGVISADVNFYGNTPFSHTNLENCRWKIGEL